MNQHVDKLNNKSRPPAIVAASFRASSIIGIAVYYQYAQYRLARRFYASWEGSSHRRSTSGN
jgi:hypothetical protein